MTILAVDVGLENGFAILAADGRLLLAAEFPVVGEGANRRLSLAGLPDLVTQFHVDGAVVEDTSAFPKQGISSAYRFGRAAGQVEGALMALKIPLGFARPSAWKKGLGVNGSKSGMRALASQRWPEHAERFAMVKHEHRAEAALLGAWWLRKQ